MNIINRLNLTIDEIAYNEKINNNTANKAIELLKEYRNYLLNHKYIDIYNFFNSDEMDLIESVLI